MQPSQRPRRKPRIVKLCCACRTISLNRNAAPTHTMGNVCWFIWTRASPMKLRGLLRPRGLSSRGKQNSRAEAEGASPPPRQAAAVRTGHQRLATWLRSSPRHSEDAVATHWPPEQSRYLSIRTQAKPHAQKLRTMGHRRDLSAVVVIPCWVCGSLRENRGRGNVMHSSRI